MLVFDIDHATHEQLAKLEAQLSYYRFIAHASHQDRSGDRRVRYVATLSRPVVLAGEWLQSAAAGTSSRSRLTARSGDASRSLSEQASADADYYLSRTTAT